MTKEHRTKILPTFWDFYQGNRDKRVLCIYGGAGSGKSYSVGQKMIVSLLTGKDKRILITRKTLPSLRMTSWYLVRQLLREYGVRHEINKSEFLIRVGTNELVAKSLDDPEKIKSAEFNEIWVEEATEITREDFMQLNLRLRRKAAKGEKNQMFLTFNPIDQYHWLIREIIDKHPKGVAIHHSTYLDNPYLPPEYIAELEDLINRDENYYNIYTLGKPGVLKNIVYSNYLVDEEFKSVDNIFYGLDFGYNNPTALVLCSLVDKEVYLSEQIYQSGLTNSDLIALMRQKGISTETYIFADPAEPARIEEIQRAGFNVIPADKSVKDGIDYVKRQRLHIHSSSVNLISEIRGYKFREKPDGQVLEEPVKFRDHLMDAVRYALYTQALEFGETPVSIDDALGRLIDVPTYGEESANLFFDGDYEVPGMM